MTTSDILADSVAPLIERIIANPLSFVAARNKNKDVNTTPSSYIILNTQEKSGTASVEKVLNNSASAQATKQQEEMRRPKSMAEAVAAYAGKKYMADNSKKDKLGKRLEKRRKLELEKFAQLTDNEEELGEELDADNKLKLIDSIDSESSQYESASEFPVENSSENDNSTETPEPTIIAPNAQIAQDDEEEDEDDEDFSPNQQTASSSAEESDEDAEDDEDAQDEEDSGETEESQAPEETKSVEEKLEVQENNDDDSLSPLEELKQNLKRDLRSSNETTPPTSPEDISQLSEDSKKKLLAKVEEYYKINETPNDRGSNDSKRIFKNWRELSNSKPLGLLNHGVTCYTNSAVQAMVHIPALQHYLNDIHNGKHDDVLKSRSVSHVLAELSYRMWAGSNNKSKKQARYVNPKKLIQSLEEINCMMSQWQQEDSHEYFMSLMSRLQEDSTPKGVKLNQSIIYDIFGGLLHQSVTCKSCGSVSDTKQEFYDLSIGLDSRKRRASIEAAAQELNGNTIKTDNEPSNTPQPNNIQSPATNANNTADKSATNEPHVKPVRYSIETSLKDFFSPELIKTDKKNKTGYICEKCHKRTNAIKVSMIDRAPESLCVHIKRFRFNGNSSSKVKHSVSYPSYLDLSEYSSDSNEKIMYQLNSVIVHEGRSVSSGHYIVHCLQPDNTWSTYDDEYVNKINERDVLRDNSAYFLVYTRLTHKSISTANGSASSSPNKKRNNSDRNERRQSFKKAKK